MYKDKPIKGLYSPCNDEIFKNILGNQNEKELMIDFLNSVFEGLCDPVSDVSIITPGNEIMRIPTCIARVDLFVTTINNHKFIVEMQNSPMKYFIERCMLYVFKKFIDQKGLVTKIDPKVMKQMMDQGIIDKDTIDRLHSLDMKETFYIEDHLDKLIQDFNTGIDGYDLDGKRRKADGLFKTSYESLYPVRLIGVLRKNQFHDRPDQFVSHYRFREDISGDLSLDKVSLTFLELEKFLSQKPELTTRLNKWLYLFGQGDKVTPEQFSSATDNDEIINRAYSKLLMSSYSRADQEKIERVQDLMDEALNELIANENEKIITQMKHSEELQDAHRSGVEEGIGIGERVGRKEAMVEMAKNLIKMNVLTAVQIAEVSGLTLDEVKGLMG